MTATPARSMSAGDPRSALRPPRWATTVGTLGVVLAVMGIIGAIQAPFTPELTAWQARMIHQTRSTAAHPPSGAEAFVNELADSMTERAPSWYRPMLYVISVVQIVTFGLYLYASIGLLKMKPGAVRWFFWTTIGVLVVTATTAAVQVAVVPLIGGFAIPFVLFGMILYVVLLSVVLAKHKQHGGGPPPLPMG